MSKEVDHDVLCYDSDASSYTSGITELVVSKKKKKKIPQSQAQAVGDDDDDDNDVLAFDEAMVFLTTPTITKPMSSKKQHGDGIEKNVAAAVLGDIVLADTTVCAPSDVTIDNGADDVPYDSSIVGLMRLHAAGWHAWFDNIASHDNKFFARCSETFTKQLELPDNDVDTSMIKTTNAYDTIELWGRATSMSYMDVVAAKTDDARRLAYDPFDFMAYVGRLRFDMQMICPNVAKVHTRLVEYLYRRIGKIAGFENIPKATRANMTLSKTISNLWRFVEEDTDIVERLLMYALLDYKNDSGGDDEEEDDDDDTNVSVDTKKNVSGGDNIIGAVAFVGKALADYWAIKYRVHTLSDYGHSAAHLIALTGDSSMAAMAPLSFAELWMRARTGTRRKRRRCADNTPDTIRTPIKPPRHFPMETALAMFLAEPTKEHFNTFVILTVRSGVGFAHVTKAPLDSASDDDDETFVHVEPFDVSMIDGADDDDDLSAARRIRLIESVLNDALLHNCVTMTRELQWAYGESSKITDTDSMPCFMLPKNTARDILSLGDMNSAGEKAWLMGFLRVACSRLEESRAALIFSFCKAYRTYPKSSDRFRAKHARIEKTTIPAVYVYGDSDDDDDDSKSDDRLVYAYDARHCSVSPWFVEYTRRITSRIHYPGTFGTATPMLAYLAYIRAV